MRKNRASGFKEYFIEFIIVLLGITIAFWLSNLSDERKARDLERQYMSDLKADLEKDLAFLNSSIELNNTKLKKLSHAITFFRKGESTLTYDSMPYFGNLVGNYNFFEPNENTYNSLQQSGNLKVLLDKEFKKSLIGLYRSYENIEQEHLNLAGALDDHFYPDFMANYDMINNEIVNIDYFKTSLFRNLVAFTINETAVLNRNYTVAQKKIKLILNAQLQE